MPFTLCVKMRSNSSQYPTQIHDSKVKAVLPVGMIAPDDNEV